MAQLFGLARVGRDVEIRYTQDGTPVANVALAFNYGKKGQDGKKSTQWVEATIWRQRAEVLAPYLLRGTSVSVTVDDVHIETYQRQDGGSGVKLVGAISAIEFAGAPPQGQTQSPPQRQAASPPQQRPAAPHAPAANLSDLEDSIPF
jgi:single-strand DNA-binding protein